MLILSSPKQTGQPVFHIHHDVVRVETGASIQFVDITEEVRSQVRASGIKNGMVNVQSRHTTATVIVNEHEPLLLEDLKRTLESLAPRDANYGHDNFAVRTVNLTPDERPNGHAHCKALFLRASEVINVVDGELDLGIWQRIFLVELDCARERTVSISIMGSPELPTSRKNAQPTKMY